MDAFFVIPGFLGTDFNEFINHFKNDYIIYIANITGHTNNYYIPESKKWVMDVYYQYKEFIKNNDNVYIIGFSMGGLIASYLMHYYNSYKVKGIILANPAFNHRYYNNISLKNVSFNYDKTKKCIKKIPKGLIKSIVELKKLSNSAIKNNYLNYNKDTLLLISRYDNVLLPNNLDYILKNIKSNYIVKYYNCNHDLFNCCQNKLVFNDIKEFVNKYNYNGD